MSQQLPKYTEIKPSLVSSVFYLKRRSDSPSGKTFSLTLHYIFVITTFFMIALFSFYANAESDCPSSLENLDFTVLNEKEISQHEWKYPDPETLIVNRYGESFTECRDYNRIAGCVEKGQIQVNIAPLKNPDNNMATALVKINNINNWTDGKIIFTYIYRPAGNETYYRIMDLSGNWHNLIVVRNGYGDCDMAMFPPPHPPRTPTSSEHRVSAVKLVMDVEKSEKLDTSILLEDYKKAIESAMASEEAINAEKAGNDESVKDTESTQQNKE